MTTTSGLPTARNRFSVSKRRFRECPPMSCAGATRHGGHLWKRSAKFPSPRALRYLCQSSCPRGLGTQETSRKSCLSDVLCALDVPLVSRDAHPVARRSPGRDMGVRSRTRGTHFDAYRSGKIGMLRKNLTMPEGCMGFDPSGIAQASSKPGGHHNRTTQSTSESNQVGESCQYSQKCGRFWVILPFVY